MNEFKCNVVNEMYYSNGDFFHLGVERLIFSFRLNMTVTRKARNKGFYPTASVNKGCINIIITNGLVVKSAKKRPIRF